MDFNTSSFTNILKAKKSLLGIILILMIAVVVGLILQHRRITKEPLGTVHLLPTPHFVKEGLADDQTPPLFPKDFPLEKGETIIINSISKSPAGMEQDTRAYETSKPLSASFTTFKDYFTGHGWTINDSSETESLASLAAVKDDLRAVVTVTKNSSDKNTVYIYIVK